MRSSVRALPAAGLVAVLLWGGGARAQGKGNHVTLNGKPVLILGLYENPTDDARLKAAVSAGMNVIQSSADAAALDRVRAAGAYAWVNLGGDLDLSVDRVAREQRLRARVRSLKRHPALLLWEGPDEALWNCSYGPSEVIHGQMLPAMGKGASAEADPAPWRVRLDRIGDLMARGMLSEAQRERERFWSDMGQKDPFPQVRIDGGASSAAQTAAGMAAGIGAVKSEDPGRPVWLNHAPRNSLPSLKLYGRPADIVGCDIYPIPHNLLTGHSDLVDMSPASVGAYTDRMRASAPGKPCIMVLQGFGWRDISSDPPPKDERIGRRPTWHETRFMAYNALMHGAAGLLWWGTAYASDTRPDGAKTLDQPLWRDLLRIASELRALEPALLVPEAPARLRLAAEENPSSGDNDGIRACLRKVGNDWVLMLANERATGRVLTVSGLPAELEGRTLHRLGSAESIQVAKGRARDGVRAYDVHVYATSRRFGPVRR